MFYIKKVKLSQEKSLFHSKSSSNRSHFVFKSYSKTVIFISYLKKLHQFLNKLNQKKNQ